MAATVTGILLTGNHASRPSSGVSAGTLYSCTTHALIYQTSDTGSTWATWADLAGSGATPTLIIPTATSPAQTTEGSAVWDSDDDVLTVGDGASRKTLENRVTTTRGDLIVRGASVNGRLAIGAAGKFLRSDATDPSWQFPPGNEFDYAQITSSASITATSEATANTVITGAGVSYDGSTIVMLEFFTPYLNITAQSLAIVLYDDTGGGAASIGLMGQYYDANAGQTVVPVHLMKRFTPSAATHTFSIRAYVNSGTGEVKADTGVNGHWLPAFMRIYKVG